MLNAGGEKRNSCIEIAMSWWFEATLRKFMIFSQFLFMHWNRRLGVKNHMFFLCWWGGGWCEWWCMMCIVYNLSIRASPNLACRYEGARGRTWLYKRLLSKIRCERHDGWYAIQTSKQECMSTRFEPVRWYVKKNDSFTSTRRGTRGAPSPPCLALGPSIVQRGRPWQIYNSCLSQIFFRGYSMSANSSSIVPTMPFRV